MSVRKARTAQSAGGLLSIGSMGPQGHLPAGASMAAAQGRKQQHAHCLLKLQPKWNTAATRLSLATWRRSWQKARSLPVPKKS